MSFIILPQDAGRRLRIAGLCTIATSMSQLGLTHTAPPCIMVGRCKGAQEDALCAVGLCSSLETLSLEMSMLVHVCNPSYLEG
jgi:hypothetical protein